MNITLKDFLDMIPPSQVVRICDLNRGETPVPYFDTYDNLTVIKGKQKHLMKNNKILHIQINNFEIMRERNEKHPVIVAWVDAFAPDILRKEQ